MPTHPIEPLAITLISPDLVDTPCSSRDHLESLISLAISLKRIADWLEQVDPKWIDLLVKERT